MNCQRSVLLLVLLFAAPTLAQPHVPMQYPPAPRDETVDEYHGTKIPDPFRPLEDVESDQTAAWVEAENEVTRAFLDDIPQREAIRKTLTKVWNYERYDLPMKRGENYFFTHNDGLQNQSVLYVTGDLAADARVLIDPNTLSEDGTVALADWQPSDDGRLLAYATADGGSDWRTWQVRDVASGEDTGDLLQWVKFSSVAWLPDSSGFFYSRYDEPAAGEELTGTNYYQKLYFHKLGTPQSEDVLVYQRPDEKTWGFSPEVTEDGRTLVITNWKGTEPEVQVFVKDLTDPDAEVVPLLEGFDAEYEFVAAADDRLFLMTDRDAPRRRLVSIPRLPGGGDEPAGERLQEIVAETDDTMQSADLLGDRFFVTYLRDARSAVTAYGIDGSSPTEIELPGLGSVSGFRGLREADETFFSFTNYVTPTAIYRFDLEGNESSLWKEPQLDLDLDGYTTEQVFYTSRDGTRIPMMLTYKKGLPRDGSTPVLLYAYGGFNINITPNFSPTTAVWLDMGGAYAVPNLRGGGEYGAEWHEAGMLERKQNVFDDFIAAAEYLIQNDYTRPERLAIRGGSNGGLLVGAAMTQRPDLFGACLPAVGVMDMLRFQKFTIGWAWVGEYGSSDDPEQFEYLIRYSPLHNLEPGTCYPPTLITTADRDDRVVPGHSFKFAAALQAAQGCDNPVLIRIETRAGHGAGTPVSKRIDEYADLWGFLARVLEIDYAPVAETGAET